MKIESDGEWGSKAAAAILDLRTMGLPNLLLDLVSRLSLFVWSALWQYVSSQESLIRCSPAALTPTQRSVVGLKNSS